MIGLCTDPRRIKVRVELGSVSSSSSSSHLCLLSLPSSQLRNSELNVRQSVKPRIADERRRTGYLRRKLGGRDPETRGGGGAEVEGGGRTEEEA
jgi:hypothetical protein